MWIVLLGLGLSSCGQTEEKPTSTPAPSATSEIAAPTAPESLVNAADIEEGRSLFQIYCQTCHVIDSDRVVVGPPLIHIATIAATRQSGVSAEQYLLDSILDPNKFIVDGFMAGIMQQNFTDTLSPDQINQLVAYMMTLE